MNDDWHKKHKEVMNDFLKFLNHRSQDFVLKGGTALMECYNLDRMSEDIDLDSKKGGKIFSIVKDFCNFYDYDCYIKKDTPTVNRIMINYGNEQKPLKIEVSLRTGFNECEVENINEIKVYNIDKLANLKLNAFNSRSKIRDAFDVAFIYNEYKDKLSENTITNMIDNVLYKGLEHIDYLIENEKDDLIDKNKLENNYLKMYSDMEQKVLEKNEYDYEYDDFDNPE